LDRKLYHNQTNDFSSTKNFQCYQYQTLAYNYATLFIVNLKLKEDTKTHCLSQISIQRTCQGFLPIIFLVISISLSL
jgi:hypothetical protein